MKHMTKVLILGTVLTVAVAALLYSATAHATPVETHATLMPCPNGPGVAVVATDENGNESWAGCWGSDPEPVYRDDHHHKTEQRRR
jgi:hypothetical protein